MKKIKKIASTDTFSVRLPVLRTGKPIESCYFDGDNLETTIHFGLFSDQKLAAIISAYKKNNNLFIEKEQIQIRGMAVLDQYRKEGFGKALLIHCEAYYTTTNTNLIWCNARTEATGFYEKMGYQKKGLPFEIEGVGTHYLMFKSI